MLILACGTCVKTCFAGGEDEVATLASLLRLARRKEGREIRIDELTVERQCEDEFLKEAAGMVADNEAVISLACGAGAQMVADRYPSAVVLPGVNTTFIGVLEKPGLFTEKCLVAATALWMSSAVFVHQPLRQEIIQRSLRRLANGNAK